ncbi:MAG TPA: hypothetical protein VGQ35_10045 [Dongiaceae bacterium]|nr:hypothetical protein [Dongiaceae bacterium]
MLRNSRIAAFVAFALAAPVMAGCAATAQTPPSGTPIAISPQTQGEIATYLRVVKVTRPGAFAVSQDGRNSFYTYCDEVACVTSNYSIPALRGCQSLSGAPCVILYVRNEQRRAFTRDENAAPGGLHKSEEQRELDFENRNSRS